MQRLQWTTESRISDEVGNDGLETWLVLRPGAGKYGKGALELPAMQPAIYNGYAVISDVLPENAPRYGDRHRLNTTSHGTTCDFD